MSNIFSSHSKWHWIGLVIILSGLPLLWMACGDGSSNSSFAGGGVGGTGIYSGIVSGFGSVFVNEIEFDTTGTLIRVDDNITTENALNVGMKVNVEAENSKALSITFEPELKGPVGSINRVNSSLIALGQTVTVDSTTIFGGIQSINDLKAGDNIRVSGFFNSAGSIVATFIELLNPDVQEFKVKGTVSNHSAGSGTFSIHGLAVDYSGIQNPPEIVNGSFIEIEGGLQGATFVATKLEIEEDMINPGSEAEIEGIITSVTSVSDFEVNGLRVNTHAGTTYKNGTKDNIARDVRVEAEGRVDSSGILMADEIEFRFFEQSDVRITGSVDAVSAIDSTVTIFGITINIDPNTLFNDESQQELRPFSLADIQQGDFLNVGGFLNNDGDVVAVKVERDDEPGQGEDRLRAPVDSEIPPESITLLDINVNIIAADFEDANDNTIDATTFFTMIEAGDVVEVKGDFSGGIFNASEVEIEEHD